jgi:hypothetical protein
MKWDKNKITKPRYQGLSHQGTDSLGVHQVHMYTDKNRMGDTGSHLNTPTELISCTNFQFLNIVPSSLPVFQTVVEVEPL